MGTSAIESSNVTGQDSEKVLVNQVTSNVLESSLESSSEIPAENIVNQCNSLIKDAKNFNLHANVLKQLLNLKDRSSGYDLYARRPSNPVTDPPDSSENVIIDSNNDKPCQSESSPSSVLPSVDLESLVETVKKLREEVAESHRLGFCLVYNIQCLHKRLTGSPIDIHSSTNLIRQLKEKYDSFKTREAILKYEFQEKRKLLRRLRNQLEETREDWKLLRVKKRRPEDEQDDLIWSETLRRKFASKRKQPSEESGFIESKDGRECLESADGPSNSDNNGTKEADLDDEGRELDNKVLVNRDSTGSTGFEDLAIALDNRRAKLDYLEDECYNLFASLSARSSDYSRAKDDRDPTNPRPTLPLAAPLLFPGDLTEGILNGVVDIDDEENDEDEEEEDEDDLSDPSSDEFDELHLPVDTLDPLETIDNTEEADMSDLPWDSNNLYESRTTSLLNEPSQSVSAYSQNTDIIAPVESNTSPTDLPSTVSVETLPGRMVNIGVGMDDDHDDDEEDEYTQKEMESLAETGEPLVLCRLRRRAVEILISRLRDEKILHESRESELKEQLEELKELNNNLVKEVKSLKSCSLNFSGWRVKMLITSMMTTFMFASSLLVYVYSK